MALLTPAQAVDLIPGRTAGVTVDVIAEAEELIALACGYPPASPGVAATMEATIYTRVVKGRGGRELTLDVWPVTLKGAVRDDPTLDWTDDAYLVDAADYAVNETGTGLRLTSTSAHGGWSKAKQIRATWTAGYPTEDAPPALRRAIAEMVKDLLQSNKTQGTTSTSGKGGSASRKEEKGAVPQRIRSKLGPFMLPRAVM